MSLCVITDAKRNYNLTIFNISLDFVFDEMHLLSILDEYYFDTNVIKIYKGKIFKVCHTKSHIKICDHIRSDHYVTVTNVIKSANYYQIYFNLAHGCLWYKPILSDNTNGIIDLGINCKCGTKHYIASGILVID